MKSSRLNPLLLVFSLLCLMFGLYGFLFGGLTEAPPTANSVSVADVTGKPAETVPDEPASRPEPTPAVKHSEPQPEAAPEAREPQVNPEWQGIITGIVVDANAAPLEGVEVVVTDMELRGIEEGQRLTSTDKEGRFRVTGLNPSASFNVVARSQSFGQTNVSDVLCGSDVRLVFGVTGVLKVRLLDEQGNPLNQASLRRHRASPTGKIEYDNSDWALAHGNDGNYSVGWHWSFLWVSFTARGYLPSRRFTADDLKVDGLEVRLQPGCRLSGTVTDLEGEPLQYATVRVMAGKAPDGSELNILDFVQDTRRTTNNNGSYQFDSLPPGTYTIEAALAGGGRTLTPETLEVTLTAEAVQDFQIDGGARATIEVRDESGEPIYGYRIVFKYPGDATRGERLDGSGSGTSEFYVLPREMMQVTVTYRDYIPQKQALDLTTGKGSLSFELVRGATIHGRVVNSNDSTLESIRTRWTPVGKDPSEGFDIYMHDGFLKAGPVVPGDWVVDVYQEAHHIEVLGTEKLASHNVQLVAGENEIALVVDCPRVLYVQVDLPEGLSAGYIAVVVGREGTTKEELLYRTVSNGRAILEIFPPAGNYFVFARANGHVSTVASVMVSEYRSTQLTLKLKKPDCVRLSAVEADSTAYTQGMKKGDLLVEYDFQQVTNKKELLRLTKLTEGRQEVAMVVIRDGERIELQVDGGALSVGVEDARK